MLQIIQKEVEEFKTETAAILNVMKGVDIRENLL